PALRRSPPLRTTLFPYTTLFRSAGALARDYHANLVILHVVQEPVVLYTEGVIPSPPEDHLEEIRERLLSLQVGDGTLAVTHRIEDRKSTRLNSSHQIISYAVFSL